MDIYRLICRQGPCSKFGQISFGCAGFRGFRHFFDVASPVFAREMHAQAGNHLTGEEILLGRKKVRFYTFNVGFAQFDLESFLRPHNLIFVVVKLQVNVSTRCRWCWKGLLVLGGCGFFLHAFFPMCVFSQSGFCWSFGFFPMCVFPKVVFVGLSVR